LTRPSNSSHIPPHRSASHFGTVNRPRALAGNWVLEVTSTGTACKYEIHAGSRHFVTDVDGNTWFDHSDWLGTMRLRNTYATPLSSWETCTSLPFGDALNCPNGDQSTVHFTGKERDAESGLDDFDARYYSSSMGRFMSPDWSESPDAVPYGVLSNPQTLNLYAYVKNNPLKDTDPTGHSGDDDIVDHILNFAVSAATTFLSDNVFGAFRPTPKSPEGTFGQAVGDFAAQQSGIAEAEAGSAGLTDAEVMVVIPGGQEAAAGDAVVSGAAVLHGTATAAIATANLAKDANQTSSRGPKANDAPGVTAGGQATDKQGNKLGPSGKPQINETNSNTREGAGNRALNEGSGKVEHPNPKQGEPHFHPTDNKGKKKPGSTHHNYPD